MVDLDSALDAIAQRYNREYRGEPIDLPPEVEAMDIFREQAAGTLAPKLASPFWELAKPKKKQICLDLGCGISLLIYPWREWDAVFYGQEVSSAAQEILNARGPQLNSKLFKGVRLAPAHRLDYDGMQFDVAIATGFSCYYSLEYWERVLSAVRKVMKPEGVFVFDVVDETQQAENWAILETYLGAEVLLEPISAWKKLIKASGARIVKEQAGEIFRLFKVKW
ncbi:MAG: class I SAM-dependent methyltransferase [Cyanobacteria bacterium P01_H01_bin.119]